MIFLPKKASGTLDSVGDYYLPENTRPLSIVGTDNRLLASAVKFCLHDFLEAWVSGAQPVSYTHLRAHETSAHL
eukprot:3436569-Alexandrium_andersonii.AAC.1